jgi:hypothetical protein
MANTMSLGRRWDQYRPTKGTCFWSGVGCAVATIVVGFAWGGWVTGGTAARMASDSAAGARAQLTAMTCISRFQNGPDAIANMTALKGASSYEQRGVIVKGGWVTMPGDSEPVTGAAEICVDKLMNADVKTPGSVQG